MAAQTATGSLKPFFRFPFQDREATSRFLTGTALLLGGFVLPIIPALFAYGYALRILHSSAEGKPPSMPAWEDWSSLLSLGLRGLAVGILYTLPATVLFILGTGVYFATFLLIPLASDSPTGSGDAFLGLFLAALGVMLLAIVGGLILLLLGLIPLPAALTHLVTHDRFSAAFRVGEWWPILTANPLGYLIAFVIVAGISAIAYYAFVVLYTTLILLCLGFLIVLPVGFYAMLVAASLFGEAYREGRQIRAQES